MGAFRAFAALALFPLLAGVLRAQAPVPAPEPKVGPLNPAFLEWREKQNEREARLAKGLPVEPTDGRLGRIPAPMLRHRVAGPISEKSAQAKQAGAGQAVFPSRFDLRAPDAVQDGIQDSIVAPVSPIRNQNPFGTCWSFGAMASAESNMNATIDLSEWHLAYFAYNPVNGMPSFTKSQLSYWEDSTFDQGGHDLIATAILTRGTGPVEEMYAPYQNTSYYPQSSLPNGTEPRALGIKDVLMYEELDMVDVKYLVQTFGALNIGIYWSDSYYSSSSHTYRYTGSSANHAVNIVGWDDSFDRTKFPSNNRPSANGAWIVRNSWGASWGEVGYFYMSYDSRVADYAMYVPNGLPADQKIYQYDTLGAVSDMGYNTDTAWFSNIFTATRDEKITDVSFWTGTLGAEYEIRVMSNVTGDPGTGTLIHGPQMGSLAQPGYHQVQLSSPATIGNGARFAIVVKVKEQGYNRPITITYPYSGYSNTWVATPGVGFISPDGAAWSDAVTGSGSQARGICLKAFTVPASGAEISVSVLPKTATLFAGGSQEFAVAVSGSAIGGGGNAAVIWAATGGAITQDGAYTAPTAKGTYLVTATSKEDGTKFDTATVTVVDSVSVGVWPKTSTLATDRTQTFAAMVLGGMGNTAVTWTAAGGSITQGGIYTPPAAIGTYTVTATSQEDPLKSDTATVTVVVPLVVAVSPSAVSLPIGGTQTFAADVTGSLGNAAVTWTASRGSITQGGIYTAPATVGTYTVTATSQEDPSRQGTATVTVIPPGSIAIANLPGGMFTGGTIAFHVDVVGLSNTAVNWSATAGTMTEDGVYTAPDQPQVVTIMAVSAQEPSVRITVHLKVSSPAFDGNAEAAPNLLGFSSAFGSEAQTDLDNYDFDNSGRVDDGDLTTLFTEMGW
jgi:C1A family cysteine protease